MRYRTAFFLCLLAFCLTAFPQEGDDLLTLRILTYNIRHGAGMDDVIDLDRQAAVIRNATPDIVGLQEVDSCVKRSSYVPQAAVLGEKAGMYATFGPAIPLTGGKYGVAILSKEQPLSVRNIPLPGKEKRTLLVCEFQEYVFACTHLDLDDSCRLASVPIILEEAAQWEKPFFICGDWNDQPTSTLITRLKRSFSFLNNLTDNTTNYTFPADKPNRIIDYIASYGIGTNRVAKSIRKRQVIYEPVASDHRPVLVELKLDRYTTDIHGPSPDSFLYGGEMYNLAGQRVTPPRGGDGRGLPRGIYIINGKKFIQQ